MLFKEEFHVIPCHVRVAVRFQIVRSLELEDYSHQNTPPKSFHHARQRAFHDYLENSPFAASATYSTMSYKASNMFQTVPLQIPCDATRGVRRNGEIASGGEAFGLEALFHLVQELAELLSAWAKKRRRVAGRHTRRVRRTAGHSAREGSRSKDAG